MQLRHMEGLYQQFMHGGLSEITHPEAFIQFQPEAEAQYKKVSNIQQQAEADYLRKRQEQDISAHAEEIIKAQTLKYQMQCQDQQGRFQQDVLAQLAIQSQKIAQANTGNEIGDMISVVEKLRTEIQEMKGE